MKIIKTILIMALMAITFGTVYSEKVTNRQSNLYLAEGIPTGSTNYIEGTFYNVGEFDNLDFNIVEISSGAITTMNIDEIEYRNNTAKLTIASSVLTSNTAVTSFEGNAITYRIYNPSANAVTYISGNVRITNN